MARGVGVLIVSPASTIVGVATSMMGIDTGLEEMAGKAAAGTVLPAMEAVSAQTIEVTVKPNKETMKNNFFNES